MPDPFRRLPNGGPMRGPIPRVPPANRPQQPPPGGTAGVAQQTPAAQLGTVLFAPGFGRGPTRPAKRGGRTIGVRTARRAAPKRGSKRRSMRKAKKAKRFVKGSAAAKRYMAKLRRMQKRRRG